MTNITDEHRAAFEALPSGRFENFALFSCFLDGEPAVSIVAVNRDGDDYINAPLFVALTSASWVQGDNNHAGEAVTELLTSLRHFCAARGMDFRDCDVSAASTFEAEIQGRTP